MALLRAKAFLRPVTTTMTSLLSMTVATPTVRAIRGTAEISLLKKRALARIVSYARVLMRVLDAKEEPGSCKDVRQITVDQIINKYVECNVTVFTDAAKEELDAAILFNLGLILIALCNKIDSGTVEDVDLFRGDIDYGE